MRSRAHGLSALLVSLGLSGCEPSTSGVCAASPHEVWIVDELSFGRIEGVTSAGFDLDGMVGVQCRARDWVTADGEPGIDNALGNLLPAVEAQVGGLRLDGLVQDSIASGQILLALELAGVDDHEADGCVGVRFRRLTGEPLLGTDNRLLPGQTLYPDPMTAVNELGEARIVESVLEPMRSDVSLPVSILDARFTLDVRDARFRITYADEDHIEGVVAGGIEVEQIVSVVSTLNIPDDLEALAGGLLRTNADLGVVDGRCTQLSAVLLFRAVPGFIGE